MVVVPRGRAKSSASPPAASSLGRRQRTAPRARGRGQIAGPRRRRRLGQHTPYRQIAPRAPAVKGAGDLLYVRYRPANAAIHLEAAPVRWPRALRCSYAKTTSRQAFNRAAVRAGGAGHATAAIASGAVNGACLHHRRTILISPPLPCRDRHDRLAGSGRRYLERNSAAQSSEQLAIRPGRKQEITQYATRASAKATSPAGWGRTIPAGGVYSR